MAYTARFVPADNLIVHLAPLIGGIGNPAILADYAGFVSVSVVTVYELAIKDIFNDFAFKKNKSFGIFISKHFERINGRIKLDILRNNIEQFGDRYLKRFNKNLNRREAATFAASHISIKAYYGNVINCRHEYVHAGTPTLTIAEVINHYQYGKEVVHCLNDTMKN